MIYQVYRGFFTLQVLVPIVKQLLTVALLVVTTLLCTSVLLYWLQCTFTENQVTASMSCF